MSDAIRPTVDSLLNEVQDKKRAKVKDIVPLIKRDFVPCQKNGQKTSNSDSHIRIMQWNLLAQGLCRCDDSFILCPKEALDWPFRQNLILEELLIYSPDIFCLQEVDHFQFLESKLSQIGYQSSFFPKPDSPCLYTKENMGPDGCAVFWNEKRLTLSSIDHIVLKRDNGRDSNQVSIVCRFKNRLNTEGREFCVSTTHLKSKTENHNLRFQQGKYLERWLMDNCADMPLIIAGDFNAEPTEKVIKVFKDSSLGLVSSYTLLSDDGSEPPYTTWKVRGNVIGQEEFCHTIDYLFYTPEYFSCTQLLAFPSGEQIGKGRLPSFSYPSDHLSLVADYHFTDKAVTL